MTRLTAAAAGIPIPERSLRVLIIDDDPLVLDSLAEILDNDNHAVGVAAGGAAGIEAFQAARRSGEPFDIVITDLGMPSVDGHRVAAEIRGSCESTPIILLTGWGARLRAEGESPPGVSRVLGKPVRLFELRRALDELTRA